jgi:hypothetical protein
VHLEFQSLVVALIMLLVSRLSTHSGSDGLEIVLSGLLRVLLELHAGFGRDLVGLILGASSLSTICVAGLRNMCSTSPR